MKRSARRVAVLVALASVPMALGSATAEAAPWHVGPVYRAEMSGEGGQYFCSKAQALEQASQSIVFVPCTYDADAGVWFRVVLNPYNWGFSF